MDERRAIRTIKFCILLGCLGFLWGCKPSPGKAVKAEKVSSGAAIRLASPPPFVLKRGAEFLLYSIPDKKPMARISNNALPSGVPPGPLLLSTRDILVYRWSKHEIKITAEAAKRLQAGSHTGQFAVFVGNRPIYSGRYLNRLAARSYAGIVMDLSQLTAAVPAVRLQLGYPAEKYFSGQDYRSDDSIRSALAKTGKLK